MRQKFLILSLFFSLICGIATAQEGIVIENGPYLQQVGDTEATIVWTTSKDGVAWVEVAPDDNTAFYETERPKYFHTNLGKKNIGKLHRVLLDSLQPNTKYRYRIFTREVLNKGEYNVRYGDVASTNVFKNKPFEFKTLDVTKKDAKFLMVNDIHADSELFTALVGNEEMKNLDFVALNGDMVSQINSAEEMFDGFLTQTSTLFAKETPMFMVRGNHETRGVMSHIFMDYFPSSTGKPYYTFKQGPVFFLVLDPGEDKPDSDIEYFGLADFDKYRRDEVKWIESVVESKEFKESAVKIVLIHIPPVGGTWHGNKELNRLFMPILNRAGIDLMLCAHEHRHRYMEKGDDGANFPMLVNSNRHSTYVEATKDQIKLRVKDDKGGVVKNITIDL